MAQYAYKPLPADGSEIRLLKLLPGFSSGDIHIEIFHAPFHPDEAPSYEALSYVWGSTENKRNIAVRDPNRNLVTSIKKLRLRLACKSRSRQAEQRGVRTLAVTQNLEVALRHLRRADESRVLWIDAICINQADQSERAAEVAHMSAIFSRASQVVAWLGPESDDSTLALETLKAIGDDVGYNEAKRDLSIVPGSATHLLGNDRGAWMARETSWIAIKNLLEREWFKRLWIVQEIKFATQAVIIVGTYSLPWNTFKSAFHWIWAEMPTSLRIFDEVDFRRINFIIESFDSTSVSGVPVLHVLQNIKNSSCSDPRDRVFAILSLLRPSVSRGFAPNYLLDPEEIYRNFTLHLIKQNLNLEILRFCMTRSPSLPSWVPNLSIPSSTALLNFSAAAGESRSEARESSDHRNLRVYGVHASTINYVSGGVPPGAKLPEILALCHSWEPKHIDTALYKGGGTMFDAYILTLIAGRIKDAMPDNFGSFPSMEDCRSFFRTCIQGGQFEELSHGHRLYVKELLEWLSGRAFFLADEGYIGLCPADSRIGDQVCVMLGCSTPLLLRPISGSDADNQLLGECYVHGLMHGEGLLGRIPSSWKRKTVQAHGRYFDIWKCYGMRSHSDPRLGVLPSGWRRRYLDAGEKVVDDPFVDDGSPRYPVFQNAGSRFWTWADPRLTSEALKARGIHIQEFILI
jgi:hypothetical protein